LQAELRTFETTRKMALMMSLRHFLTGSLLMAAAHLGAREFQCPDHPFRLSLPDAWSRIETPDNTPKTVKLLLRGEGRAEVPPTVNIAVEQLPAATTTQHYLECVRALYESNPLANYSYLGALPGGRTPLELVQVQLTTPWGDMELLQGILIQNDKAFIVTASARQDEFCEQLPTFIRALQSFNSPSKSELAIASH
jgi:hypothetical protein